MIDATHDTRRRSFVESANGHGTFPLQNLPFGVFSPRGEAPRGGVAIGEEIFDLKAACEAGLCSGPAEKAAQAASGPALNSLFALGAAPRAALRARLSSLLDADGADRARIEALRRLLHKTADCELHLPARIGCHKTTSIADCAMG